MPLRPSPFHYLAYSYMKKLDNYIKKYNRFLTCDNICGFYYDWFHLSNDYKGNSRDLEVFSELIIFRIVVHLKLCYDRVDNHFDNSELNIRLHQNNLVLHANNQQTRPDIVIFHNDNVFSVIEIKTHPPGGANLQNLLNNHQILRAENNSYTLLLIIFNLDGNNQAMIDLEHFTAENPWFKLIILNHPNFKETLIIDHLRPFLPE
ncbi:MAG: hypothetical protein HeimC3_32150 [Candidatus Heimdallarchaeota archaeon LC_3]|nr:MAG: hypothetical protein HeimC3_32150 [Candidatus Heimdallarchaeota archaeon LC_3]